VARVADQRVGDAAKRDTRGACDADVDAALGVLPAGRTMSQSHARSRDGRNTVLVASGSRVFIDIVGEMVAVSGRGIATSAHAEPAWLAVTRTQPALVICDCAGPEPEIKRLIGEVVARRIPLLMVAPTDQPALARTWPLPDRVAWLEFPIARDLFHTTIDELLLSEREIMQRHLALRGPGVTIEAAIEAHTLEA
jgi:hypothetical protein